MDMSRSARQYQLPGEIVTALGALLLALAACADPTAPLPREGAPDELRFSISGFGTGFSNWELRGDTLIYRTATSDSPAPVTEVRTIPSAEAWRTFWVESKRAGLGRWRCEYIAEGIVDGEGWSTRVRAGNVVVVASGSNAYPDELGREQEGSRTAAFRAYIAALRQLAGVS